MDLKILGKELTMDKFIRFKQRMQNFEKAFSQFEKGVFIKNLSDLEKQGLIKSFEYTSELAWKSLKDYLESQNVDVSFPREVIKQGFHYELIDDGEIWLEMLNNRNLLVHTYDETKADELCLNSNSNYKKEKR